MRSHGGGTVVRSVPTWARRSCCTSRRFDPDRPHARDRVCSRRLALPL